MGDFNLDLLHYETNNQSRDFLNKMFSASLKPHIATPSRITPRSKTLIDNIFTNFLDVDIVCGNLTCFTSDHLAQFLIYTNKTVYNSLKNLDKRKFKEELENIEWNQLLAVYCNDPNIS